MLAYFCYLINVKSIEIDLNMGFGVLLGSFLSNQGVVTFIRKPGQGSRYLTSDVFYLWTYARQSLCQEPVEGVSHPW